MHRDGSTLTPTELDKLIAYTAEHPESSLTVEVKIHGTPQR